MGVTSSYLVTLQPIPYDRLTDRPCENFKNHLERTEREVLNQFLYGNQKQVKPISVRPPEKRIKKHDIKIPLKESIYDQLTINAQLNEQTTTQYCTEIITKIMSWTPEGKYPKSYYHTSPYMVHVMLPEKEYQIIKKHAREWKCSKRQAAHRIFLSGLVAHEII